MIAWQQPDFLARRKLTESVPVRLQYRGQQLVAGGALGEGVTRGKFSDDVITAAPVYRGPVCVSVSGSLFDAAKEAGRGVQYVNASDTRVASVQVVL